MSVSELYSQVSAGLGRGRAGTGEAAGRGRALRAAAALRGAFSSGSGSRGWLETSPSLLPALSWASLTSGGGESLLFRERPALTGRSSAPG